MGVLKESSQEIGKKEVEVSFPPRQVQVVALLPDLLVYNNHSLRRMLPSMETFNGVLLCVEITGLTALLEKLYTNNDLNCGMEQLTQMLNDYIEGIMEHVLCFGGDILNFTGDALLVLWKVERSQLSDIITLAAKCSLEMQKQFRFSYTEVGPELRLKIGLSAGHVSQLIVGDEMRQYWLVTGQQVDDVRLAQSLAQAREVILSPNCWELCDRDVLEAEMLKGQKARKIDDNQPLEFVSELRLVTAVSVKLQFHENTKMTELCKLVQDATVSISGIMEGWRGKIIKISTFGKYKQERRENLTLLTQRLDILTQGMFGKSGFTRKKDGNRPLLGRKKEIRIFQAALQEFMRHREGRVVMYEGSTGYGKSRLIAEIDYLAREENHRVIALELSKVDIQESFYAIRSLMAIFFGIDACRPYKRQDILQSKLSGLWDETFYCLLNNQFLVKFPMSAEVSHMDNETKQKEEEMLFLRVLRKAAGEATLVFIIDEAQYIDATSWDFLAKLLLSVPIFIVLSLSPFASKELLPCASAEGIMKSPKTTGIVLRELEPSKLLEMARQALGVVSIPREMETFLIQRSFGVPLYCEALLTDLHANGVLEFCRIPEEEKEEDEWDKLSISAVKSIPYRAPLVSSKENKELYVCTVRTGVDLDTVLLPARLQEIAVAQLDSLSPSEQMAVKCAAVIGHTFTPELLLYILPEWTNKKMEETLMSLICSHVFEYVGKETRATQAVGSCHLHTHLGPLTMQSLGPEDSEDVGAAAPSFSLQEELGMLQQDQAMRFCTPLLREGAYELWLGDQKKALHLKCATFLEHKAHKCRSCGGGDFVSFHRYALDTQMSNEASLLGQGSKTKGTAQVLSEETGKRLQTSLAQDAPERTDASLGQELAIETPMASCEDNLQCRAKSAMNKQVLPDDHLRVEQEFLDRVDKLIKYHKRGKEEATNLAPCECGERVELVVSALARHCLMRPKLKINQFEEATFCSLRGEFANKVCNLRALLDPGFLEEQSYSLDSTTNRKYSRLAALMEINLADESENKMQFSQSMGYKDEWLKYEMMAIQRSSQCNFTFTRERLLMTAQLAQALAYSKLCLGHLTRSIQLGFDYRPIEECLQFINQYEASCILKSQSNIMLSLYSSLAIW
ncbi:adenylate cyclase type 10-like [Lepidochelys kempii]|uniref:adenylate cyclase type 10-like n=1 Tax=Lepidochelys kempii TaxID=8472 RepID=UPI003C6FD1F4